MFKKLPVVLYLVLIFSVSATAQWKYLNPQPSGYACNKILFTDAQNGFIINGNGDLLRTTDQGDHWEIRQSFPGNTTMDIKDSTGIIAGGSYSIYISSDNGNSWLYKNNNIITGVKMAKVVSRDTIFLASESGSIYRSDDRGNSWQKFSCGITISSVEFVNSKVGYAGGSSQYILKTTDGGATWQQVVAVNTYPSNTLAIRFLDERTGFAFREHSSLLSTKDGGVTWSTYDMVDDIYCFYFLNKTTGFACGEDGVTYRTDDGGATWKWISATGRYGGYGLYGAYFFDSNTGFTVGTRGRILKTTDGGASWKTYSPTYTPVSDLAVPDANTIYAIAGTAIFKSGNGGAAWQQLPLTVGGAYEYDVFQTCHFFTRDTGFVTASDYARMYKTYDGGASWKQINVNQYAYDDVTAMQFLTKDTGYLTLYTYYGGAIVKTNDAGETWTEIWKSQYYGETFSKVQFINQKTAYAARYGQLYKTTDGAATWTQLWDDKWITSICFVNEAVGYVAGESGMLKKTVDSGKTWTKISTPAMYDDIYSMRFLNQQTGFLTAEYGRIYKTIDGGQTWTSYGNVGADALRTIRFGQDTTVFMAGDNGIIIKAGIDEGAIEGLNATSIGCKISMTAIITTNNNTADNISFQYGISAFDKEVAANPSSVTKNGRELVGAMINEQLTPSTLYKMRVKLQYGGQYRYSNEYYFRTPALSPAPVITAEGKDLRSSAPTGNQWYLNDVAIQGAIAATYTPAVSGTYTVRAQVNNCWTAFSAPLNYVLTGINSPELERAIWIGPNPVPDQLYVQYTGTTGSLTITITDMWGRNIYRSNFSGPLMVDMRSYLAGAYIIYIKNQRNGQELRKMIIKN